MFEIEGGEEPWTAGAPPAATARRAKPAGETPAVQAAPSQRRRAQAKDQSARRRHVVGRASASRDARRRAEADAVPVAAMPRTPRRSEARRKPSRKPAPRDAAVREWSQAHASPAVRARAQELGIDLGHVRGTGPDGRITHDDLDAVLVPAVGSRRAGSRWPRRNGIEPVKVIGLRRKIAEKMQDAKRRIPHFAYVEEVDLTELEELRAHLNATKRTDQPKLTLLPFLMRALVLALPDFPQINARFDDERASSIATTPSTSASPRKPRTA